MLTKLNNPDRFHTREAAEALVAQLLEDDDTWSYKVVEVGNAQGLVRVEAFDEDGNSLGYL